MGFYAVLITENEFCIASSKNLPIEFKDKMHLVKCFPSQSEAERYVYEMLTSGDLWNFGVMDFFGSNQIEIGKIYFKNS